MNNPSFTDRPEAGYNGHRSSSFLGESSLETQHIQEPDLEPSRRNKNTQQLEPGTTLSNRYLIQNVVGLGGMGAVYRARDLHFPNVNKIVAVKEMVNLARDEIVRNTIVRNFEREANILATLDHRAIPRIYDYFTHNERSYLILEYIRGSNLDEVLNETEGFLPEERVVQWALELCDVLSYLHAHQPEPIIFRDIKPSNVMVNHHGHIVLVDFGIAKPFQGQQRGTMIGTEGYSPPEQYRGEANHLADIYALGATIHHLLTRRDPRLEPPFSFGERPIRQINPSVSPGLEQVINKALQYEPHDRYQTAAEMKAALTATARETGILKKIQPAYAGTNRGGTGVRPLWEFACEDEVRGTPNISRGIIYVGSYDNNLYALEAASGNFLWKYPAEGGIVSRPAFFEDQVLFGSEDHDLHVVNARTGRLVWRYATDGPIRSSPFVAEGHVFIGSDDAYLHAINLLSNRRTWRVEVGAPVRSTPIVTKEYVFFGTESGDFYCMDFRSAIKWRYKSKRGITGSPILRDDIVYFNSMDSMLYALDARTGWLIWRFRMSKASISTPCIAANYIFTGCVDGQIYCLDIQSGRKVWTFSTNNQVTGSPVIYKDSLYCGSVDGNIYCLEYRTGRLRWKYATGGPITGTPVANRDILYIGSTDHRMYAFMAQG